MNFNWEEFKASDNIAVHCKTEEEAKDFCKQMHEHGMKWTNGESYLKTTNWGNNYEEETCYEADGTYADAEYYEKENYTILEWSNYMNAEKENNMNLELNNLTEEQKQQIIELAKKFEQENETDKLNKETDYCVVSNDGEVIKTNRVILEYAQECFNLGLTAHTIEEAEKIRRRLLVEKELRDWAKKCKEPVDWESGQRKYYVQYEGNIEKITIDDFCNYATANIAFTDRNILEQAIESIGQERLIRDYFSIDK